MPTHTHHITKVDHTHTTRASMAGTNTQLDILVADGSRWVTDTQTGHTVVSCIFRDIEQLVLMLL